MENIKRVRCNTNAFEVGHIQRKRFLMVEWHPFLGLASTIEQQNSPDAAIDTPVLFDAIGFMLSWANNSKSVTRIHVTKGVNNTMTIQYGTPIESNMSGRSISLDALLVERYYNFSPTIIFTASKKADEIIRNCFGVSGEGRFSMDMKFGKVEFGEYGYYMVLEDGRLYQLPILHKDSSYKIYHHLDGNSSVVLDAADVLRNARLNMSDSEAAIVMKQLVKHGYVN